MKVRKLFSGFFSILLLLSVVLYLNKMDEALGIYPYEAKINLAPLPEKLDHVPGKLEFIYLGGGSFKTVGSRPVYANDCIGCGELGNIHIYHNSESDEQTDYALKANCNVESNFVEIGYQYNEKGEKIGERCVIILPSGQARLFWTESSKDHFILSAPSLDILKAFEISETYKLYKSSSIKK